MHTAQSTDFQVTDSLPIFHNPQAWSGPDMALRRDWIRELSAAEVGELVAAVSVAEDSGLDFLDLRRRHFPLPTLAATLHEIRNEVLHGRGFALMRGVPVERMSMRQSALAYWGLGLYLGDAVSQNGKGHVLGHVKNLGLDYADPEVRGYQTSARLNFHCDFSDLVSLLCLKTSKKGGLSSIVSSTTLWNEMARTRPELARALMAPLYYTRWGEIPEGKQRHAEMPVFTAWKNRMIAFYVRSAVNKCQNFPEVPRLTELQIEAMDHLDRLAADSRFYLDMEFRPGDVQILCNHFTLHSRTAYEDWPEMAERRHLLRLWLACDDGPELPACFTEYQGPTASGRPDGIRVPGIPLIAPLEAS